MDASPANSSLSSRPSARRAERSVSTSAAAFQKTTRSDSSTAMTASGNPASTAWKFMPYRAAGSRQNQVGRRVERQRGALARGQAAEAGGGDHRGVVRAQPRRRDVQTDPVLL